MDEKHSSSVELLHPFQDGAGEVTAILAVGELGEQDLCAIGDELLRLARDGRSKVILDLSQVDHLDYRGLKPLVGKAKALRACGGDLKLAGPSAYLLAIMRVAGAQEAFHCYRTIEEARSEFEDGGDAAVELAG